MLIYVHIQIKQLRSYWQDPLFLGKRPRGCSPVLRVSFCFTQGLISERESYATHYQNGPDAGSTFWLPEFIQKLTHICNVRNCVFVIGLSHIRVSTHVSTAYRDTKGTSHVRRRYVGKRSSYSSIRSSYSSYAEVLRFFMCALKNS